jgi:cellobiose phosphorylase
MVGLIVESLLGIARSGTRLALSPQLPLSWTGFRLHYLFRKPSTHTVRVAERDALVVELQVARQRGTAIAAESQAIQQKTTS